MNTYRIFMKDGYASLQNAETEQEAREKAVAGAKRSCEGCAMTPAEKRKATTVDSVEKLN